MRRSVLLSLLMAAILAVAGTSGAGATQLLDRAGAPLHQATWQENVPEDDAALMESYLIAVKDAQVAEPGEISRDLVAVVESNDQLVWRDGPDGRQLLVSTWTSWTGYNDQVGQTNTIGKETWITVAPELQSFCRASGLEDPTLRLEQLLGLPPHNGKQWFVELWVSPADLFRPSADPDITDHEAELSFPDSAFTSVNQEYKDWYNDLNGTSYGENGYPWTRLGYTYDWGDPNSEIGLSEFVIRKGASVQVQSVSDTLGYCR